MRVGIPKDMTRILEHLVEETRSELDRESGESEMRETAALLEVKVCDQEIHCAAVEQAA